MRSSRAVPRTACGQAVHPATHVLGIPLSKVGFPIRKSADQSSFAAPRGLSQRSTSFIASQRQGIHQMPLRHLIALIINAHPSRRWRGELAFVAAGNDLERPVCFIRPIRRRGGQASPTKTSPAQIPPARLSSSEISIAGNVWRRRAAGDISHARHSDRSPLHDVR